MDPAGATGFGGMFAVFPVIFVIAFILIGGVIVFGIVRGLAEWSNNNRQPVLTVDAQVKAKRTRVSDSTVNQDGQMQHNSSTTYYVTFEVPSGDRMEFRVSGREYGMLAEGDDGRLTFQGTRYHGFQRLTPANQSLS